MFQNDAFSLGLIIAALGLVVYILVRLLILWGAKANLKPQVAPAGAPVFESSLVEHGDALLAVQAGGRIVTINDLARSVFHLQKDETPNLEVLSRHVRPSEQFLELCTGEGQGRFVLEGRPVEITSYQVISQIGLLMVVVLRFAESAAGLVADQNAQTLQRVTELTQAMATNLDLEAMLKAIFETIERTLPADFQQIGVWEAGSDFLTLYRFTGEVGEERTLEQVAEPARFGKDLAGFLAQERKPVLAADIRALAGLPSDLNIDNLPFKSYLGVPLLVGKELIGTLELGSIAKEVYQQPDLELIQILAGQAAVAVRNAILYRQEQRRAAELSGLAAMTQALGSVRDPESLFERLVNSIAPLFPVEIIGFLIYDESQHSFQGQVPFHGLPSQILEMYRVPIQPNSSIEQAFWSQDIILTENAVEDAQWNQLGLSHLANAASLRETALVPITSSGRMLGYLQASNHVNSSKSFDQEELHLLMIIANQVGPIIENATLVQQSRQRAQRAEALRRLSSLAGSSATLEEILKFSLQELTQLLQADVAAIFLLDQNQAVLRFHQSSLAGQLEILPEPDTSLALEDPQFHFTVTGNQRLLHHGQLSSQEAIVPFYRQIIHFWGLESLVVVPLVVRQQGIGELWIGSQKMENFDRADAQVAMTAAGQLAGVIEQAYLAAQTDESLRRRVEQMTALARINRELSTSLDLNYLMRLVYDEALSTTGADCGSIVLFDPTRAEGTTPKIRFFVGDIPLENLSPIELQVLEQSNPYNLPDVHKVGMSFPHEGVVSALIVPIFYRRKPAGLISLHSNQGAHFDPYAVESAQSLADQAAVALGNALQYGEQARRGELLKRELETLGRLFQVSQELRAKRPLQDSLQAIADAIPQVTPFQVVLISIVPPASKTLTRICSTGLSEQTWDELRSRAQPWSGIEKLLLPDYRVGLEHQAAALAPGRQRSILNRPGDEAFKIDLVNIYYIPADKQPVIPEEVHMVTLLPLSDKHEVDSWHPDDFLLVPLYNQDGQPIGLISLDGPADGRRPDRPTLEALELFGMQAALMIESHWQITDLEARLSKLEIEQNRLQQAASQAKESLPLLLHKDLEQTLSIQRLKLQVERLRTGLGIAEITSRQESISAALQTVGQELLSRLGMQAALLAEATTSGVRLLDAIGNISSKSRPEALFGQRNPLRETLLTRQVNLVADLENDPQWRSNSLLTALGARSFICLPLEIGREHTIGILVVGQKPLPPFTPDDQQIYSQLARQVSVGLENLQLLIEARRRLKEVDLLLAFGLKLGSLNPTGIMQTLIESALQVVPAAQAGWVGLWENQQVVLPRAALGYPDPESLLGIHYSFAANFQVTNEAEFSALLRVLSIGQSKRLDEVNFSRDYRLSAEDLLRYRKGTGGRLPVSSLLIPLRAGVNVLGILVLDNFSDPAAFSREDETLVASLAQQTALSLENARLLVSASQRASQLQALTEVAGTISSSLRQTELVASLLQQLKAILPYDTASLWLRKGERLEIAAASGFTESDRHLGLSIETRRSLLFQEMIQTNQPIYVTDVRQDERFSSVFKPEFLSWLGIPLISKGELTGVIAVEKRQSGFYTVEHLQAARTFVSQAAIALENARLYEDSVSRAAELDERTQRLALLNRLSGELSGSLDVDFILKLVAQQLLSALGVSRVAAVLLDSRGQVFLQVETPAWMENLPMLLPELPLFERLRESTGIFNANDIAVEPEIALLRQSYFEPRQARSLLVVPLLTGANLHGWLWLQTSEQRRFTLPEIELARTISNQAATAIQNARLFAETNRLTEELEQRVQERTAEMQREHQNTQTLLHIITELSASLDTRQIFNRTLNVINEALGAEQSMILLARQEGGVYQAGLQLATVQDEGHPIKVEAEITRWVVKHRLAVLVDDVLNDARWNLPAGFEVSYRSVLAVPITAGEEVLGALLLLHRRQTYFQIEQAGVIEATARQIGIALNNAELFNLVRDQAENLGAMLRTQQIEASRSRAILEAVADGVLVTDAQNIITLFNASAERILGIGAKKVLSQPLEKFTGLFGRAAGTWVQTIRAWSAVRPRSYSPSETYAEQINLENGRVVAVHLAPVFFRSQFLGTVSIFRDITHEVQVDRLKSEFVANVSHELRTPMTSIKGYVDIMLMGVTGELSAQQKYFLQIVKTNTDRLIVLVNDLLDLARIDAGRISLSLQPLDVGMITRDVVSEFQLRSQEENKLIAFRLDAPGDLPKVLGDAERVRQVLASLMSNGYNYTPENGMVTVRLRALKNEVQVDIQDNGIGISPTDQERIFERFFRGEDPLVLASAGTGLGLAISKNLVEMHQGRIWFYSSGIIGEGSTFSFTLPIYQVEG